MELLKNLSVSIIGVIHYFRDVGTLRMLNARRFLTSMDWLALTLHAIHPKQTHLW